MTGRNWKGDRLTFTACMSMDFCFGTVFIEENLIICITLMGTCYGKTLVLFSEYQNNVICCVYNTVESVIMFLPLLCRFTVYLFDNCLCPMRQTLKWHLIRIRKRQSDNDAELHANTRRSRAHTASTLWRRLDAHYRLQLWNVTESEPRTV